MVVARVLALDGDRFYVVGSGPVGPVGRAAPEDSALTKPQQDAWNKVEKAHELVIEAKHFSGLRAACVLFSEVFGTGDGGTPVIAEAETLHPEWGKHFQNSRFEYARTLRTIRRFDASFAQLHELHSLAAAADSPARVLWTVTAEMAKTLACAGSFDDAAALQMDVVSLTAAAFAAEAEAEGGVRAGTGPAKVSDFARECQVLATQLGWAGDTAQAGEWRETALEAGPWQDPQQLPLTYHPGIESRPWHSAEQHPSLQPALGILLARAGDLLAEYTALEQGLDVAEREHVQEQECLHDQHQGAVSAAPACRSAPLQRTPRRVHASESRVCTALKSQSANLAQVVRR